MTRTSKTRKPKVTDLDLVKEIQNACPNRQGHSQVSGGCQWCGWDELVLTSR